MTLDAARLVTSEAVSIEFVNFFSNRGAQTRQRIAHCARMLLEDSALELLPMTDCISMQMMREQALLEALTHDHHFAQEGFVPLLRPK